MYDLFQKPKCHPAKAWIDLVGAERYAVANRLGIAYSYLGGILSGHIGATMALEEKLKRIIGECQDWLKQKIAEDRNSLESFPSIEEVKKESEKRRRIAMLYFGSMARLKTMTFDEKKELLHWLFDGIDSEGTLYGIYINTKAKGTYDYFIYSRLIEGLRTVKGGDIDYYPDEKQKAEVVEFKGEDSN